MLKKIFILLLILIFTVGIVSAADFKAPDNFNKSDDTHFVNDNYYLSINNYTDDQHDFWFKSNLGLHHHVFTFKNDTYQSISGNEIGIFEMIEVNNQKYIVQVWSLDNPNNCYNYLMEFNRVNNLTQIHVM